MELDETEAFCAEPPGTAVSVFDFAGSAGTAADVAPDGPSGGAGQPVCHSGGYRQRRSSGRKRGGCEHLPGLDDQSDDGPSGP